MREIAEGDIEWNINQGFYGHLNILISIMTQLRVNRDVSTWYDIIRKAYIMVAPRISIKEKESFNTQFSNISKLFQSSNINTRSKVGTLNRNQIIDEAINLLDNLERELIEAMTKYELLPKNATRLPAGEAVRGMFRN